MRGNFGAIPTKELEVPGTCPHVRITYRATILLTNPPQHPWVCPDCLEEGVSMRNTRHKNPPETYEEIIDRKKKGIANG